MRTKVLCGDQSDAWVIGGVASSFAREKMFDRDNVPATNFNS